MMDLPTGAAAAVLRNNKQQQPQTFPPYANHPTETSPTLIDITCKMNEKEEKAIVSEINPRPNLAGQTRSERGGE